MEEGGKVRGGEGGGRGVEAETIIMAREVVFIHCYKTLPFP